jgi:hypothetical protein
MSVDYGDDTITIAPKLAEEQHSAWGGRHPVGWPRTGGPRPVSHESHVGERTVLLACPLHAKQANIGSI